MRSASDGVSTVPGAIALQRMPLVHEVGGDGLGEADDRRLATRRRRSGWASPSRSTAIDAMLMMLAPRPVASNLASIFGSVAADRHVHRAHVEVEAEVPVLRRAVEDRAVVDVAGAVEQDVERRQFVGERLAIAASSSTSSVRVSSRWRTPEYCSEQLRLDVGREDVRAFARHRDAPWRGRCPARRP